MYIVCGDLGFIKKGMFPNFSKQMAEHVQFVTDHIVDLIGNSKL
jgi:hypothetical protein